MKIEKVLSLFQIFVMIVGVISFVYFIGAEFGFVSAEGDATCNEYCTSEGGAGGTGSSCVSSQTICASKGGEYAGAQYDCNTAQPICCCTGVSSSTEEETTTTEEETTTNTCGMALGESCLTFSDCNTYGGTQNDKTCPETGDICCGGLTNGITPTVTTSTDTNNENKKSDEEDVEDIAKDAANIATGEVTKNVLKNNLALAIGNVIAAAGVAAGLFAGVSWLTSLVDSRWSEEHGQNLEWWVTSGYMAGVVTVEILTLAGAEVPAVLGTYVGFSLAGLGVAAVAAGIYFLFVYRDVKYQRVVYTCMPWRPATDGDDCRKCNEGDMPCTKYKCESLGMLCELLNEGTEDELCESLDPNDILPPQISTWAEPLKDNQEYDPTTATLAPTTAGEIGVDVINTEDTEGIFPAFTTLTIGIELDKPGLCKIDVERKDTFEEMTTTLSYGYYKEQHTITLYHSTTQGEEGIILPNGGEYEIFVRCQSKQGYSNVGELAFRYEVSDEPDTTAPTIVNILPPDQSPISAGTSEQYIEVYTNKPAECKWDNRDVTYDNMENEMESCNVAGVCGLNVDQVTEDAVVRNAQLVYRQTTTLTGLQDNEDNVYYLNCKSYPTSQESDRFTMTTNKEYTLTGTRELLIDWVTPDDETVRESTESVRVELNAHTSAGYDDGVALCSFRQTYPEQAGVVLFSDTNSYEHSHEIWRTEGDYEFTIECCDAGSNCASQDIAFTVEADRDAPVVVRAYKENKNLKIITNEVSECVYDTTTCNYDFEDGIALTSSNNLEHTTSWDTDTTFYVKCKDEFGVEPASGECSVIARPFSGY